MLNKFLIMEWIIIIAVFSIWLHCQINGGLVSRLISSVIFAVSMVFFCGLAIKIARFHQKAQVAKIVENAVANYPNTIRKDYAQVIEEFKRSEDAGTKYLSVETRRIREKWYNKVHFEGQQEPQYSFPDK